MMPETNVEAAEVFHGVGGLITNPAKVDLIWQRLRAGYRKQLISLHTDALMSYTPRRDSQQARYASAGELAMQPGGRAVSKLIMSNLVDGSIRDIHNTLITDCHLSDPFIGFTVIRPSPTCIAWHSTCPAEQVEESPLFEAIITVCERTTFPPGHEAIHTIETGDGDEVMWSVGDGARLLSATRHRA